MKIQKSNGPIIHLIRGSVANMYHRVAITAMPKRKIRSASGMVVRGVRTRRVTAQPKALGKILLVGMRPLAHLNENTAIDHEFFVRLSPTFSIIRYPRIGAEICSR